MSFFNNFPLELYRFGNEVEGTVIQNLSAYVDIIDELKDTASFYEKYEILEGERADVLSSKLYGSQEFYWTFYCMNDNIKKHGFPLRETELTAWVKKKYTNTVLTTKNQFFDKLLPGETVLGQTSGTTGTVVSRNLDLGQIVIQGTKAFTAAGEVVQKQSNSTKYVTVEASTDRSEHLALRYYTDASGNQVDVDPSVGEAGSYAIVTNLDHHSAVNKKNREIRVIRPGAISRIFTLYKQSLVNS